MAVPHSGGDVVGCSGRTGADSPKVGHDEHDGGHELTL